MKEKIIDSISGLARGMKLLLRIIKYSFKPPYEIKITVNQMVDIGVKSLPIILLTSFFTGMVLALQTGFSTISIFNEPLYVGTVVAFSFIKELSPVLTSIVITGRVGAAITAELGTMRVTEQIDALYTLGTDPVKYLIIPRFLACFFMVPVLTMFSDFTGVIGGFLVGNTRLEVPSSIYWSDTFDFLCVDDFFHGIIKSAFFGGIIALISCYKGFECEGGAEGVGKSTTSAVVTTLVLILITDYFLTALLVALRIG